MKKRILGFHIESGYHVLSVFLEELAKGFEALGYEVDLFQAAEGFAISTLLQKPFYEYEFVFCVNAAIQDVGEFFIYMPATTPFVAYMVDHPIYHDNKLNNACLSYLVTNVSRERDAYIAARYKNIDKHQFIPHGGSKAALDIPFENRKYDVVFLGGYTDPMHMQEELDALPKEIAAFNTCIVELLASDETMSWGTAMEYSCKKYGLNPSETQFKELGKMAISADGLFRAYTRELLIKTLIGAGIQVDVFGRGWETMECENRENLRVHEPVDYSEALKIMADSRIVLNSTLSLNTGAHERIFSAMANGAVCVTNYSSYLKEAGLEDMVVPYSIYELNRLPQTIRDLLSHPAEAREMTARAQACALEHHMWRNRAEEIIAMVEEYKREHLYEKACYRNEVEMRFGELCKFIKANTYELLLEKMKSAICQRLRKDPDRTKIMLNYYSYCGSWGSCLPEEENYVLLENRAHELKEHLSDFVWMQEHLADERSKAVLYEIMCHWLDYAPGHLKRIKETIYDPYFDHDIIACKEEEVFVDLGAGVGETVGDYIKNYQTYQRIYCYDMDEKNLEKCRNSFRFFEHIEYHRAGITIRLNEDISEPITLLKLDLGGYEQKALMDIKDRIIQDHPKMAISVHHNNEDIWKIGRMIYEMDPTYSFYMRYYGEDLYPNAYVLYAV